MKLQSREVVAVPENFKAAAESQDLEGIEEKDKNPELQLKYIAVAKASLERHDVLLETWLRAILDCQRALCMKKQQL